MIHTKARNKKTSKDKLIENTHNISQNSPKRIPMKNAKSFSVCLHFLKGNSNTPI